MTEDQEVDSGPPPKSTFGLDRNIVCVLAYAVGWLSGMAFLILERKDKEVRFHALNAVLLFGPINIFIVGLFTLTLFFRDQPLLKFMFGTAAFFVPLVAVLFWGWVMFKAYKGEELKIPVTTEIARRFTLE
jgi:uncharacterized membrane protein